MTLRRHRLSAAILDENKWRDFRRKVAGLLKPAHRTLVVVIDELPFRRTVLHPDMNIPANRENKSVLRRCNE